jgi:cell division septation protein DedD
LDLADPSRKQLAEWISASAYTKWFLGIEKKSIQQAAVTLATSALVSPISQDNDGISESRSGTSSHLRLLSEELDPKNPDLRSAEELNGDRKSSLRIVVPLALVFLSSIVGFIAHHSGRTRNNLQTGDITSAAKSPETPSEDTTVPVKSLSEATPFSTPPARLDLPGFVLQVGAMKQETNADALAKLLQEKNFPAFVFRRGTNRFYRVAVGPYSGKDSAVRVKDELEKEGLKAFLRSWVPE